MSSADKKIEDMMSRAAALRNEAVNWRAEGSLNLAVLALITAAEIEEAAAKVGKVLAPKEDAKASRGLLKKKEKKQKRSRKASKDLRWLEDADDKLRVKVGKGRRGKNKLEAPKDVPKVCPENLEPPHPLPGLPVEETSVHDSGIYLQMFIPLVACILFIF
jgi:hypothetical protein